MPQRVLKRILALLACGCLAGSPGCAAQDPAPQTMGDWMALDQVNP